MIKNSLHSLAKFLKSKNTKENSLKDTILKKNDEIESLKNLISLKASDQSQSSKFLEDLIKKDFEIIKLKKMIGDLKDSEYKNKPPVHGTKHKRSKTLSSLDTSPFKIQSKFSINELNFTKASSPEGSDKIDEGNVFTTSSTDRMGDDKIEIYEKKIEVLSLSLMKHKNQRDRAKNLSEKLLLELKQKKLDLAMVQEDFSEQKFALINQLKTITTYLFSLSTCSLLPKVLKQDLSKILNHYSSYL